MKKISKEHIELHYVWLLTRDFANKTALASSENTYFFDELICFYNVFLSTEIYYKKWKIYRKKYTNCAMIKMKLWIKTRVYN